MSNNNPETQKSPATGGLPLRGLAMVLIAVAVLLGLWGLYSLTQDGEDPTQTAESTNSAPANTADGTPAEPGSAGAGAPADNPDPAVPADPDAPVSSDDAADADRDPAGEEDGAAASTGTASPADPAAGGGAPAAAPAKLNVLNNSTVPELAASVSEKLGGEGYQLGEVGNFSDEIFPETTVFFQGGNSEAEAKARELASRLGGVAREHVDSLPEGTDGADDLTLVLVKEVIL
ncbi:LytR C-terminal domain-containing protein [Corynebacterium sp. A21]|uniref:LytR C-terminal domain-containing protein n=1 Tax=Corynebacterium sp. A21 TaxID=3457318 RepID=UPI003FD46BE0